MKKPFNFAERSEDVVCANTKCAMVRGAEGVSRMPIKKNVIARSSGENPILCYDCEVFRKTGKTRKQRKGAERERKAARARARTLKVVAAEA